MIAKIIGMFTGLPPWVLYVGAGALLILGIVAANAYENSTIRKEATVEANAISEKKTMEAINVLSNEADKRRAKLAYCRSVDKLYDFSADKCIDG